MRDTIDIPENNRFASITELESDNFHNSGSYANIARSDNIVFIQIALKAGTTVKKKRTFYAEIAKRLKTGPCVRLEDVFTNLIEVSIEDWSLGYGVAQYA